MLCAAPARSVQADESRPAPEKSSSGLQTNAENRISGTWKSRDAESESQTMEFTDVYGEVHTLTIDPTAPMHNYEASCWILVDQDMYYTDSGRYTSRLGIDVSFYQGDIDWVSVKAAGYEFAFIRLGYRGYGRSGSLTVDSRFQSNLQGAKDAGLEVGVYFFSQAISESEAAEEAAFVIDKLGGTQLDLPIVYDPEFILDGEGNKLSTARTSTLTGEQITQNTLAFCQAVETAGYEAAFYSNMLSESEVFDMTALADYTVWYADYNVLPQTPYDFTFWQYTDTGSVAGIEGNVDLNIQLIPVESFESAESTLTVIPEFCPPTEE